MQQLLRPRRTAHLTALLGLVCASCGLFSADDPESFDDGGGGGDCDVEADLIGKWITEGDTEQSDSYNTLEFRSGGSGYLFMYAGGYTMDLSFQWRIEGDCDEIHYDYGTGWMSEYSVIHELTSSKLDLEATDGSYYGMRTRYDRLGSGGSSNPADGDDGSDADDDAGADDGGTPNTCGQPCSIDLAGIDCGVGQKCHETDDGPRCISAACDICFNDGATCMWDASACTLIDCGPPAPSTCALPCASDIDCDAGQACLESAEGLRCTNPQCQACWDADQLCVFNSLTCELQNCE